MQRLGFFGGCFNPPTIAHLELALKAIEVAKLDKLYFVPMGDYYKKEGLAPAEDRFQMLKIITKGYSKLEVSRIQMEQKRNLYAIDTFRLISEQFKNSQNYFIMGSDNYEKIKKWKCSEELLKSYKYIVFNRGNFNSNEVIVIDDNDYFKKISSTMVRNKTLNLENIEDLVTKNVKNYILKKKLYR